MKQEGFKLIMLFLTPFSQSKMMFKHGTWAGRPAELRQQKGTLFKITSTHYCKQKKGGGGEVGAGGRGTAALSDSLLFPV